MTLSIREILPLVCYAYPATISIWFVTTYLYAVCTLQLRELRGVVHKTLFRHASLIILLTALTASYVAQAVGMIVDGLTTGFWAEDCRIIGAFYCALTFAVQISKLAGNRRHVWWAYWGSWILAVGWETLLVFVGVFTLRIGHRYTRSLVFFTMTGVRLFVLITMLVGTSVRKSKYKTRTGTDEERQGLLAGTKVPTSGCLASGQPSYGTPQHVEGTGTDSSSSASASESESVLDLDSDLDNDDRQQAARGFRDRLKESGSWIAYAKSYAILLPYLWPARSMILQSRAIGVVACLFITNLLHLLIPRQTAIIVDKLGAATMAGIWTDISVFVALRFLASRGGIELVQEWLLLPLTYYSEEQMTRAIYSHIMHLSADFHDSKTTSDMNSAINGATSIFNLLEMVLLHATPMVMDLVVAIVYLSITFGPYEGLIVLSTGVLFLLTAGRLVERSRETAKRRRATRYRENYLRYTGLSGWHTVAAFNQIGYEDNRHANAVTERYDAEKRFSMVWAFSTGIQHITLLLGLAASVFLATARIRSGSASPGQFAMLLMYWSQLVSPLHFIVHLGKRISDNFIDAEHTLSIMRTKTSVVNRLNARPFKFVKGHIQFHNVGFSYDNKKQIIKDVCLEVDGGQTIAFVGATGAGKSTMLKLLNRFYDITEGSIQIDDQNIREVELHSLRDRIGVVPQDPLLFDDTIMNNVRYGKITATDEEVYEACRAACVHDKIVGFTDGYGTQVGERGVKLSGGELQRIAIARAILKKPDMILLDEATSAVDTETEYQIQQSLKKLCQGRTTFVVAHRLSTIMNADRILVVDQGQIIEEGTHEELIVQNGRYANLWAKQVFLKPKTPLKQDLVEVDILNDLSTEVNAQELAKIKSQLPPQLSGRDSQQNLGQES